MEKSIISLDNYGNKFCFNIDSVTKIFGIERPPKDAKITKNQFGIHYKYQIEGIYYNIKINFFAIEEINSILREDFEIEESLVEFDNTETNCFIAVHVHVGDICDLRHTFGRIILKLAHKS